MESARLQGEQTKSESVSESAGNSSARSARTTRSGVMTMPRFAENELAMLTLATNPQFQSKLTVGAAGDQYEQEADRVAEQVMRMSDPAIRLQRQCACGGAGGTCDQCASRPTLVQRHANAFKNPASTVAPQIVSEVLGSSGRPLDASTRAFMEERFGRDFGQVRIHSDERAGESAGAVNAFAYTVGQNVIFGAGQYAPQTNAGRRLLAHELTHVVQQTPAASPSTGSLTTGHISDQSESRSNAQSSRQAPLMTTRAEHAVAPMIQRDPIPSDFGTGNIRLREDGQIEFLYGTPNAPVTGPLGIGARCNNGRCQFVFGQDPSQIDNRTYSVSEIADLLKGFAGGGAAGPGPRPPGSPGLPSPVIPGGPLPATPGQPSSGICLAWDILGRCTRSIPLPPAAAPGTTPGPGRPGTFSSTRPPFSLGSNLQLTLEHSRTIDHFGRDVHAIPNGNDDLLNQLATAINLSPDGDVFIEGHTDSSSTPLHNQPLSERRATAVRDALINRGVAAARLRVQGFGERRLRFPEERDDEEKALNRRVEVRYRAPLPGPSRFELPPSLRLGR